jgi:hypothetical protein
MGVPDGDATRRFQSGAQLTPSGFESRVPTGNKKDPLPEAFFITRRMGDSNFHMPHYAFRTSRQKTA